MVVEVPIPIALLLADDVYQDASTGKWVIAVVFSQIWTTRLPTVRELVVFGKLRQSTTLWICASESNTRTLGIQFLRLEVR
jgi:hypothetical protein